MNSAQISEALPSVPKWQLIDSTISRSFTFGNFIEAFGFMSQVALLAEAANHHPNWSNIYNRVDISLSTHDINSLSEKDFALARQIDSLTLAYDL